MNRKLLVYIAAVAILQSMASQAKPKIPLTTNVATQNLSLPIKSSYFLQITIAENDCEKLLGKSCIFRDKMLSEPYLHEAKLTIFLDKIYATQSFSDKIMLMPVKNGSFSIATDNNNLISFNTTNGAVSNLKLVKGDLTKEPNTISKCKKAENIYNFHNTYNTDALLIKSGIYKDEYDFRGLNEYVLFSEKQNQSEIMALTIGDDQKITAISNLQLCKMPDVDTLRARHLSTDECFGDDKALEECFKYQECKNSITIEDCEVTLFQDGF